jgi:hypothetical protein
MRTSMTHTLVSRRLLVAGAGALAAAPAMAAAPKAKTTSFTEKTIPATGIETLWQEAEVLRGRLGAHRDAIVEAARSGGIAGWMRLGGEANRLGEARYAKLVAILRARPESPSDLAIMARVTLDEDMRGGAHGWAADQLALATISLHGPELA